MGYDNWKSDDQLYAEGAAYFSAGDFLNAYTSLYGLAAKGHAAAQYCVGVIHYMGIQGYPAYKDDAKAREYLKLSADQGCQEAITYLNQYLGGYTRPQEPVRAENEPGKSFDSAKEAYMKKDFAAAVRSLDQAARDGYGPAQVLLAYCYEKGRGMEANLQYAAYWYGQAAVQGDAHAQLKMGMMYLRGTGVERSAETAAQWLRLAADQGNPEAMDAILGLESGSFQPDPKEEFQDDSDEEFQDDSDEEFWDEPDEETDEEMEIEEEEDEDQEPEELIYRKPKPDKSYMDRSVIEYLGENSEEDIIRLAKNATASGMSHFDEGDIEEAVNDFKIGAQFGNPIAQYFLGLMYKHGRGVETDLYTAKEWFLRAEALGSKHAQKELAELTHIKIRTGEDYMQMSREANEAGDEKNGMRYLRMAADKGALDAQLFLGIVLTMEPNDSVEDGIEYLEGAGAQGSKEALGLLGNLYYDEKILPRNTKKAMHYWNKAAEKGSTDAMVRLGTVLVTGDTLGDDVQADAKQAYFWFKEAADQGDAGGKRGLGLLYAIGEGVPADRNRAKAYLQEAIRDGDEAAKELYKQLF